jgi:hypothetical protein
MRRSDLCLNSPQAGNDSVLISSKQDSEGSICHQQKGSTRFGRLSTSPSPPISDIGTDVNGTKKRMISDPSAPRSAPYRRKTACKSCRTRKVKCDNRRPCCAFCLSSGVECVYLDGGSKLPLDPATKLMVQRLDEILHGVEGLNTLLNRQATTRTPPHPHLTAQTCRHPCIASSACNMVRVCRR